MKNCLALCALIATATPALSEQRAIWPFFTVPDAGFGVGLRLECAAPGQDTGRYTLPVNCKLDNLSIHFSEVRGDWLDFDRRWNTSAEFDVGQVVCTGGSVPDPASPFPLVAHCVIHVEGRVFSATFHDIGQFQFFDKNTPTPDEVILSWVTIFAHKVHRLP